MTEVSFARTFLSTLDAKPTKIPADHVEDPRSYPSRPPYILPRSHRPFSAPVSSSSTSPSTSHPPGSEPSLTVTLKSLRNPPLDIRLTSQSPNTSLLDVKNAVASQTGLPVDKMRLLYKKKPVADSKVLKELVEEEGQREVELGVMVLGGAATVAAAAAAAAGGKAAEEGGQTEAKVGGEETDKHVAVGPHGTAVLETEEFWTDLGGFLQQRIRDEGAAKEVLGRFKGAWEGR
ncbi:cell-cycle control medial ring component [Coniochaeta sp. 2T2.1]|nr:cell-cycle control medial ring component [Coniochaeta sp. 2T2.1]